jgi:hypothetical protein
MPPTIPVLQPGFDVTGIVCGMLRCFSDDGLFQPLLKLFVMVDGELHVLLCDEKNCESCEALLKHFREFRRPKEFGIMPIYSRRYRLTSLPDGEFEFVDLGLVKKEELYAAHAASVDIEELSTRTQQ